MSGTTQGPSVWDKFGDFVLDVGRSRLIDVERTTDDRNIPDSTDVRTGNSPKVTGVAAPAIPLMKIAGLVALSIGAMFAVVKLAR
jgi:hypothetical protein